MSNQNDVKVFIKNGDKEINLELSVTDEYQKLFIINQVFSVFGIETDLLKSYKDIESVYKSFFQKMSQEEEMPAKLPDKQLKYHASDFSKKLEEGLRSSYEEIAVTTVEEVQPLNSKWDRFDNVRRIKEKDGVKHYQLYYNCSNIDCERDGLHKGIHFIRSDAKTVKCRCCFTSLEVRPAHPEGFPHQDTRGNYFVAGRFQDFTLWGRS